MPEFAADPADLLNVLAMIFVIAEREIQTADIDAGADE
jgi:hypothetical protein